MPAQDKFFIAKMPVEKLKSFQVMQSLVDPDTSFAVMPHDLLDHGLVAQDIADIKAVMEIKGDEMLIMLIASIQHTTSGARLSVNLRAPVFINTDTKEAYQIVLANGKYQVQHFLG
jgi:flagellar assembly factor FliW